MRIETKLIIVLSLFILMLNPVMSDYGTAVDASKYKYTDIPEDSKAKILSALPEKAQAGTSEQRRVLVFNLHIRKGEVMTGHPAIPFFNFAFEQMGLRTGAYSVTFGNDPEMLRKEFLDQFDAVIFNNTAGVLTEDPELQWGLLDYIWSGGGFVGVHAAGATFCQWPDYDIFPEFGEMLGGFENGGHPWKPHEWINLKIDDPDHPVAYAFGGENFDVSDEVFQFSEPYSRERLRVLTSIDTARTDMDPARRILPERLADGDIAISWVKRYGRGNVFYSSLGHNVHLAWDDKVLQQYLDGIQFVIGDLPAPVTPSAKLDPAMEAQEKLGWRLGIEAYTFRDLTLFEAINRARELGLAYTGGWNRQMISKEIQKRLEPGLSTDELRQIRSKLVMNGVSMLTYFHFDLPGDEKASREIFEFAQQLGVEVILSEPKVEDLDLIERLCEEYRIKVGLHNHGKRLSPVYSDPEKLLQACEGRSKFIGAAADFGYWVREGIDPMEALKLLGDRVISLQVHDLDKLTSEAKDVPWGSGEIGLNTILKYFAESGIQPVMFGLEYSRDWGKSMPAIQQSIDWYDVQTLKLAKDADK